MYVLRLERLERVVLAERTAVMLAGEPGSALPSVDAAQERFDGWLVSDPAPVESASVTLLRKLGVA